MAAGKKNDVTRKKRALQALGSAKKAMEMKIVSQAYWVLCYLGIVPQDYSKSFIEYIAGLQGVKIVGEKEEKNNQKKNQAKKEKVKSTEIHLGLPHAIQ